MLSRNLPIRMQALPPFPHLRQTLVFFNFVPLNFLPGFWAPRQPGRFAATRVTHPAGIATGDQF
jgi:hypothetical protein